MQPGLTGLFFQNDCEELGQDRGPVTSGGDLPISRISKVTRKPCLTKFRGQGPGTVFRGRPDIPALEGLGNGGISNSIPSNKLRLRLSKSLAT